MCRDCLSFSCGTPRMRFSEIPSTARVRLEIEQRRVLCLFPFERKAAEKLEKPDRISTSMWTLFDGNMNEAEFDGTTNMFLLDSPKHKNKSRRAVLENCHFTAGQPSLKEKTKINFGFNVRRECIPDLHDSITGVPRGSGTDTSIIRN